MSAVTLIRPVTDFYARVLGSRRLAPFFEGTAMEVLVSKQAAFISAAIAGEITYSDADLERVHARFDIDDIVFDELISLLRSALDDHAIDSEQTGRIVEVFEKYRSVIVR